MNRHATLAIVIAAALSGYAVASLPSYPVATEARLIGDCGGRIMAGIEEDSFPAGCAWIEPIRMESDAVPAETFKDLRPAAVIARRLVESN